MATLRNRKKLEAVSTGRPENTRNSQSQNTLDPETAQEYISQVAEEIEERVTKKLSEEFSRIESRTLGALSKLDEFRLSPQSSDLFRSCSGIIQEQQLRKPGTHRGSFPRRSLSRSGVLCLSLW